MNTGVAIANPNNQAAFISFFFTDSSGQNFRQGSTTIPANGQIAAFLDQAPFNSGSPVNGTFTFNSSVPVSAVALRGLTNERSDFLITTLPIADPTASVQESIVFPHFADGAGWTTQIVLVNPTEQTLSGIAQFIGQGAGSSPAQPVSVTIDGRSDSQFQYSIAPRSSRRLATSGSGSTIQAGSVRVTPATGNASPVGVAIFAFRSGGVTVSEAGVPASRSGAAFRLYGEAFGGLDTGPGALETGIAIANTVRTAGTVLFEWTDLAGTPTGMVGSTTLPPDGQLAMFLTQIPGLDRLRATLATRVRVQGNLKISATTQVAVIGLRGRYNERGDFLVTTTPPASQIPSAGDLFFPHLADGGGYTTQFVLFGGATQASSGVLSFFTQAGQPLALNLR